MRILIATGIFPPDSGGPATYSSLLGQELKKRGKKIELICYSSFWRLTDSHFAFPVRRVWRGWPLLIRYFWFFFWLLVKSFKYDIIYAQDLIASGLPALLVKWLTGKKIAIKIVGDYAWEQAQIQRGLRIDIDEFQNIKVRGKIGLLKKIQTFILKRSDLVITPSHYLKNLVSRWGVPPERVKVIYNAIVGRREVDLNKQIAQREIDIQGDIILTVARLVPWKGIDLLIELMPELVKKNPNFKLVIVGDGPYGPALERLIKKLGLENSVVLTGSISRSRIANYYAAATMFVLNSGYEGFSHVILEAMKYHLPVIASDKGGNKELIISDFNGLLLPYNDKSSWREGILRLWGSQELRKRLTQEKIYKLPIFDVNRMVSDTLQALAGLTKKVKQG